MSITWIFIITLLVLEVLHFVLMNKAPTLSDVLGKIAYGLVIVWIILGLVLRFI